MANRSFLSRVWAECKNEIMTRSTSRIRRWNTSQIKELGKEELKKMRANGFILPPVAATLEKSTCYGLHFSAGFYSPCTLMKEVDRFSLQSHRTFLEQYSVQSHVTVKIFDYYPYHKILAVEPIYCNAVSYAQEKPPDAWSWSSGKGRLFLDGFFRFFFFVDPRFYYQPGFVENMFVTAAGEVKILSFFEIVESTAKENMYEVERWAKELSDGNVPLFISTIFTHLPKLNSSCKEVLFRPPCIRPRMEALGWAFALKEFCFTYNRNFEFLFKACVPETNWLEDIRIFEEFDRWMVLREFKCSHSKNSRFGRYESCDVVDYFITVMKHLAEDVKFVQVPIVVGWKDKNQKFPFHPSQIEAGKKPSPYIDYMTMKILAKPFLLGDLIKAGFVDEDIITFLRENPEYYLPDKLSDLPAPSVGFTHMWELFDKIEDKADLLGLMWAGLNYCLENNSTDEGVKQFVLSYLVK